VAGLRSSALRVALAAGFTKPRAGRILTESHEMHGTSRPLPARIQQARAQSTLGAALLIVWCSAAASCGGGAAPTSATPAPTPSAELTPVAASADWPASTLGGEHLDPARLGDLVLRIRRGDYGRITSLVVARRGRLVVEEYFNGWSAERPHTMQSVTKSVVSLLAGMAAGAGKLSVSDRATRFFPAYEPLANFDAGKAAMTVRDLLTMRTGLDWSEDPYAGSPLQRLNDCRCDWIRFVLDWRMREAPGTRWEYVSGGVILAGGIIGAATGRRLDEFASAQLFDPIGAAGAYWISGLPDGLPHGGGGLFLRPRDAAKLGQVVLDQGRWQGRQLVDAGWIAESTQPVVRGVRAWAGHAFDYGYLWWLTTDGGDEIVTASGAGGQWIFAIPRRQLVVVSTGDNNDGRAIAAVAFLFSHVLPAVME
jgi:CubicO group peptidase (beta-lactamase class C family)